MILYYSLSTVYVLSCLLLLLVVLLQQGRGGDIASAFGGGGSQTAFGARAGATLLTKATAVLGALFMLTALALAVLGQRGPGSVVSGFKQVTPGTPAKQAAPVPPSSMPLKPQQSQPQPAQQQPGQAQPTPAQPNQPPRP